MDVALLPVSPGVRSLLLVSGFSTRFQFDASKADDLSKATGLSIEDAKEVLSVGCVPQQRWIQCSAAEDAEQHRSTLRVITFCADLDRLLDGGVTCGRVTEFSGAPGVGKTQLGIQLAVDAQIPVAFGGTGGAAVYIDTEGSFMLDRVQEIADAAVKHVANCARSKARKDPSMASLTAAAHEFTVNKVLNNIHTFRVHDVVEQLAVLHLLPDFLRQHPEVRVVVVDSITFHFRADLKDMAARSRSMATLAQLFMQVAEEFNVAVVYTNQVTTRVTGDTSAHLVPALGESWGQAASTRVVLHWQGNERHAFLLKSPSMPSGSARYDVIKDGVRGVRQHKRPAPS